MRASRSETLLAGVASAVPSLAYLSTAARDVLGGDNGELATIAVTGGAAHPPGYPLFALYLQAARGLSSSPAHAAAIANALLGCAMVVVLLQACRAWGASAGASAVVVVVASLGPAPWALASQAEVFTLNALFAAILLLLTAPGAEARPGRRAPALAFVAGLALANHYTIGALAPIGLPAFVRAVRGSTRPAAALTASGAALIAGLAPYGYLFAVGPMGADPSTWSWGNVHDLASLGATVGRDEYADLRVAGLDHVAAHVARVTVDLFGLPVLAAVAAGLVLVRPRESGFARVVPWLGLAASAALAGPIFAAVFDKPLDGPGVAVLERFDVLPVTLLTPVCARAIDRIARPAMARPRLAALSLAVACVAGVARGLPGVRARHRPAVALYVHNALLAAPEGAVVLGSGDQRLGGFLYARYALGLRPDVVFVNPRMLFEPWYLERVERAVAAPLPRPRDRRLDVVAYLDALLATGRPVLVADLFSPAALGRFPSYPVGPLVRLVRRREDVPSPQRLLEDNEALAARFVREPLPVPGPEPWGDALLPDYARPWASLADAFDRGGDAERAAALRRRAEEARAGAY